MKPSTSHSVSRLKFKILFDHPISNSLSYSSLRYWWFEIILSITRHIEDPEVKRRKIWSPQLHIACHVWNLRYILIFLFSIPYHIYNEGHDDLRIFFQIQDIWRTLKSKEGRYGALHFIYHVTFEIKNAFWPFIFPFLLISIMNFMISEEYSSKYSGGLWSQKKVYMEPWTS